PKSLTGLHLQSTQKQRDKDRSKQAIADELCDQNFHHVLVTVILFSQSAEKLDNTPHRSTTSSAHLLAAA
ncbi:MAG: hypothetical protein WB563_19550, partial [Pseudolabrys sp.]